MIRYRILVLSLIGNRPIVYQKIEFRESVHVVLRRSKLLVVELRPFKIAWRVRSNNSLNKEPLVIS